MKLFRTRMRFLRWALAGLIALVSVVQMPSMVVAFHDLWAVHREHKVAHSHHGTLQPSHQQHANSIADDGVDAVDNAYGTLTCHVVGCCLALNPVCGAPSLFDQVLGPIDAAAARAMV